MLLLSTIFAWGGSSVWLERFPVTEEVAGSSPVHPANCSITSALERSKMPKKSSKVRKSKTPSKRMVESNPLVTNVSLSKFMLKDSYVSLILGIIVVVIAAFLLVILLRAKHGTKNVSIDKILNGVSTENMQQAKTVSQSQKTYTVKEGDTLWSISQSQYGSGYNWVDIAKANNVLNPGLIETGQKFSIPQNIKVINPKQLVANPINGPNYIIVKNDSLWTIAVRAYGDGYKWVDIAKANKIANPNLIYSGNLLTIPR